MKGRAAAALCLTASLAVAQPVPQRSGLEIASLDHTSRPQDDLYQHANARWMEEAGAATIVEDEDLDAERLIAAVEPLLADRERLEEMAAASRLLARPDAADRVAAEILIAATGGGGDR